MAFQDEEAGRLSKETPVPCNGRFPNEVDLGQSFIRPKPTTLFCFVQREFGR